jgi:hypothetical protein
MTLCCSDHVTLPNIIRAFGSPVYGASVGAKAVDLPWIIDGGLNVAVNGAVADELRFQVRVNSASASASMRLKQSRGFAPPCTPHASVSADHPKLRTAVCDTKSIHIQALNVFSKMKVYRNISIETDWKVLTIFIGVNDLCEQCSETSSALAPEAYVKSVEETLDVLKQDVPRV